MFRPGEWAWSLEHQQIFMVVETQGLWEDTLVRFWVPTKDAIVRIRSSQLQSAAERAPRGSAWLSYLTAAARVSDALTQEDNVWQAYDQVSLRSSDRVCARGLQSSADPERRRRVTIRR